MAPPGFANSWIDLAAASRPSAPGAGGGPGREPQVQTHVVPRDGGGISRTLGSSLLRLAWSTRDPGHGMGTRNPNCGWSDRISGNTRPTDAVVDACKGCDILFHEVHSIAYGPQGPIGAALGHTSAAEVSVRLPDARTRNSLFSTIKRMATQRTISFVKSASPSRAESSMRAISTGFDRPSESFAALRGRLKKDGRYRRVQAPATTKISP